ncbi:MAG TPA: Ig-like domain-containing protein [Candidatus Limnocylindrales bacterium]|nr:Ig-like domain-containing protein [Candidatus Limnocylindrales bacterium]
MYTTIWGWKQLAWSGAALILILTMYALGVPAQQANAQTCTTAPATTYGKVTQSVTVGTAGTYRVWSRIKAPTTTHNSYYLQVDGGCAVNVGDNAAIPANVWTWVSYKDGTTSAFIDVSLTVGTHQLTYTGKEANVQLDRVLLLGDRTCVPIGLGDNCVTADTTAPTTAITTPAAGATITAGSTVTVTASASDSAGVTKVEFYIDGALKGTDTTSPYAYAWNTTGVAAGSHTISSRAYDAAGNTSTSALVSVTVTVPPTAVSIPFRMNTGGPAFTDPSGANWQADTFATGGSVVSRDPALAIANTTNDNLYRHERYGMTAYSIPIASGTYKYRLHFAETYPACTTAGCRVFSVATEGTPFITSLDIIGAVGPNAALVREGTITVSDGNATFNFSGTTTNKPLINGIEILPNTTPTDTTPPAVNVTAPANGSSVAVGTSVTIAANATDNVGVSKVGFYQGTTLLGTDTTAPYSYGWNTAGVAAGAKSLTAKAYDVAGNATTSSVVTLNLTTAVSGGDANGDKRVNAIDLSIVISKDGQAYPSADFNGDGTVGAADMAILLSKWTW